MATAWRKVITSGSQAHLKSLVTATGIGVPAGIDDSNPSNISASAIFATTAEGGSTGDIDKIAIVPRVAGVNEVLYTGSGALSSNVKLLEYGSGISGSLKTDVGSGWSGSLEGTILIDSSSLAGDGLTGALEANKIAVDISSLAGAGTNRNLAFDGDFGNRLDIDVSGNGIQGFGTKAASQFSSLAIKTDEATTATTFINSSNQLTASIPGFIGNLEGGNGISLGSGYNGSTSGEELRIQSSDINGTGLSADDTGNLTINTGSGAALTANSALIFNQTSFITSSIVEDSSANTIRVGKADGTTSVSTDASDLIVEGTFKAENENYFSVKDKFVLLASGSNDGVADAQFGFVGEISTTEGIGWNASGSRWTMTTGSLASNGRYGGEAGAIPLMLATGDIGTGDAFDLKKGNMIRVDANNFYIYAPSA